MKKQPNKNAEEMMKRLRDIPDPFVDGAHLDLSCSPPDWSAPPEEETCYIDTSGYVREGTFKGQRNPIKEFVTNPDKETLAQLAQTDPELRERLLDEAATETIMEFRNQRPDYEVTERNYATMIRAMGERLLKDYARIPFDDLLKTLQERDLFSAAELCVTFDELTKAGKLDVKPGQVKELSDEQLRDVAATIHIEGIGNAIEQYLIYAIGWGVVTPARKSD
jgi:hypothetical protein